MAKLHKPVIFATGIAHLEDIERAMNVCREEGNEDVILLKCVSAYPTPYEDVNLRMIPTLSQTFGCLTGLSDHTMGGAVAAGAVSLGARMVEKHLTLKRNDGGPDGAFSMEPQEFKEMVSQIRILERHSALPNTALPPSRKRTGRLPFHLRRAGHGRGRSFTEQNIRCIRPGIGLHTMYYEEILGRKASCPIGKGTPLSWNLIR